MLKMKMATASAVTVLLLLGSFFSTADSLAGCDLYAGARMNFTVPLLLKMDRSDRLKWILNSTVIFERRGKELSLGNQEDVSQNGSLLLKNVDKLKEGKYRPEIYNNGKAKGNLKSMYLCVLDPVSTPQVKIECPKGKVLFTCMVDPRAKDVTIEWLKNEKLQKDEKNKLLIQELKAVERDAFTCRVSNKVSAALSASIKQNCTVPGFVFPPRLLGINSWIVVGTGGGVVVLLIILTIICCICNRRRKRMQVKEEEELRLGWVKTNQQQNQPQHKHNYCQPHHQHQHQQQPAGNTGPRQHRPKPQHTKRAQEPKNADSHPHPSPRRAAQGARPVDDEEQPPPLPQPRKKAAQRPREPMRH